MATETPNGEGRGIRRAFRYCNHDVGHAIACVSVAAAALGWEARLLESLVDSELATLLGTHSQTGAETEHVDCLLAVFPQICDAAGSPRLMGQTVPLGRSY